MVSKGDRIVVLYPLYFDANRSRAEGRRVPRKLAVASPKLEELAEAARQADYRVEVEADRSHPRRPWAGDGRVLIVGGGKKSAIVQAVGEVLKAQRS